MKDAGMNLTKEDHAWQRLSDHVSVLINSSESFPTCLGTREMLLISSHEEKTEHLVSTNEGGNQSVGKNEKTLE